MVSYQGTAWLLRRRDAWYQEPQVFIPQGHKYSPYSLLVVLPKIVIFSFSWVVIVCCPSNYLSGQMGSYHLFPLHLSLASAYTNISIYLYPNTFWNFFPPWAIPSQSNLFLLRVHSSFHVPHHGPSLWKGRFNEIGRWERGEKECRYPKPMGR